MYKHIVNVLFFIPILCRSQEFPTVCLEQEGTCYKGSWLSSPSNDNIRYASFQGIRYAQPPIGELRFKSPQPFHPKPGVCYDVSNISHISCPQFVNDGEGDYVVGQEDCLLLNIYIPEIVFKEVEINSFSDVKTKLPVMFWIHGGSYLFGSNNFDQYGPNQFMKDQNVILISINYRLGPFGFFSMGTEEVPGNAGLRDQNLALIWVQNYIEDFGGDSSMVTIFGESCGSFSIAMHLISPLSRGLYRRAILESGTALSPGFGQITVDHAVQYAYMCAKELQCDQEEQDVLACLQSKDMSDIIKSMTYIMGGNPNIGPLIWIAVSDLGIVPDPFLPGNAEQLMASGEFNTEVEIMIGTNSDEGILNILGTVFKDPQFWDYMRNNIETFGPKVLFNIADESEITKEDVQNMYKVIEFYFGSVDNINEEHIQALIDMFTDTFFQYGHNRTIEYFLQEKMKIFQYLLTYEGKYSMTNIYGVDPLGVCHADDLIYLFDPIFGGILPELPDRDKAVRETMTTAWLNFAIHGDPTPPNSELPLWTPCTMESKLYWNISGPLPNMDSSEDIFRRMTLWDEITGRRST